jgi:very-short-patch-repair endonuclease
MQTEAEEILWQRIRNRRLNGLKFRRQHPLAYFIADFFCLECNLVIEIDGDYHNETGQKDYDEGRTFELQELNIFVIRFTNSEVIDNINFVLAEILKAAKFRHENFPFFGLKSERPGGKA